MNEKLLIAFVRGLPGPVLANRVLWYEDSDFNPDAPKNRRRAARRGFASEFVRALFWAVLISGCVAVIAWYVDTHHF